MRPIVAARRACDKSQDAAGTAILPPVGADFAGQQAMDGVRGLSIMTKTSTTEGRKK
jgi:hypothetical protein